MCQRGYDFSRACARKSVESHVLPYYGKIFRDMCQNYPLGTIFIGFCASKGMNFGQNFVPIRVRVCKICANEGRGSVAPS